MKKFLEAVYATYRDLSTALREDGPFSPYSSKRVAMAALVVSLILSGFSILATVGKIALSGSAFSPWLTIALLGVPSLFLLGALIFGYISTKKDLDDTLKIAADIIRNERAKE